MEEEEARIGLVRGLSLSLTVLAAVLVAWTLTGRSTPAAHIEASDGPAAGDAPSAPTYAELRQGVATGIRTRQAAAFAALQRREPTDPNGARNESSAADTRIRRAQLRAFEGAPPQVPHPVQQRDYPNCSSCHERGLHVQDRWAAAMSHDAMANCLQCHVVASTPLPGAPRARNTDGTQNHFVAMAPQTHGARAWPGAPPGIPHSTHMRERCIACHGVAGTGIGTTHPALQNCVQCHPLTATWEQQPLARSASMGAIQ